MENVIENNKLIAEFMGGRVSEIWKVAGIPEYAWRGDVAERWRKEKIGLSIGTVIRVNDLLFHSSWDWLIPVVEKIEDLYEGALIFYIKDERAHIERDPQAVLAFSDWLPDVPDCYSGFCDTKLKAVYSTVVQFIKWYNQQTSN